MWRTGRPATADFPFGQRLCRQSGDSPHARDSTEQLAHLETCTLSGARPHVLAVIEHASRRITQAARNLVKLAM